MEKWYTKPGFILGVVALVIIASATTLAMSDKVPGDSALQIMGGAVFGGIVGFFGGLAQGRKEK